MTNNKGDDMVRRLMVAAILLVVVASIGHASQTTNKLMFLNGSYALSLKSTAACTTKWYDCNRGRVQALYFQGWVNKGATDSVRVKVDYQRLVLPDTGYIVTATDTVTTAAIGRPADTLGTPRGFDRQYTPKPCWRIRFIYTGLSGNSDSTNVGNAVLRQDDLQ